MGDKVVLTVEERDVLGKKVKQLRKQGMVPGVVYGQDMDAVAVMAPAPVAAKAWREAGKHHPVELTIGTKKRLAMIKSADVDPVKHRLRHLSLHVVRQNEKVETEVPLKVKGEGETPAEKSWFGSAASARGGNNSGHPGQLARLFGSSWRQAGRTWRPRQYI